VRTVKEVAAQLAVSEALVYGWVESGLLPCYRLGGRGKRGAIRITDADLNAFLDKCRHEKERPPARPAAPSPPPRPLPAAFKHLRVN
jgi:excisionase family DNA binding protein